jgi:hypothetical protein
MYTGRHCAAADTSAMATTGECDDALDADIDGVIIPGPCCW